MKRTLILAALGVAFGGACALVACGSDTASTMDGGNNGNADLAMPGGGSGTDVTSAKGDNHDFIVDSISLPKKSKDYSVDLDGDGKQDNALALIINILGTQMLDAQGGVTASVNNGEVLLPLSIQATDATLANDPATGVTLYTGVPSPCVRTDAGVPVPDAGVCPDFNGMGTFNVDKKETPAVFLGKIASSAFSSNDPVTTKLPVHAVLKLALVNGSPPVALPLNGAHIQFTVANGKLEGSLQGAVRKTELQNSVLPTIVGFLNDTIKKEPGGMTAKGILDLFDTGCKNDPKAKAGDGKIDLCELAENDLIAGLLSPDVQMFNPSGSDTYGPVPKCNPMTTCDSISIGVGFTAVPAKINK